MNTTIVVSTGSDAQPEADSKPPSTHNEAPARSNRVAETLALHTWADQLSQNKAIQIAFISPAVSTLCGRVGTPLAHQARFGVDRKREELLVRF